MAGLRANGLLDNTIVVFTSDHGDNLGSHHRFNKGLLIEESIRIPMIFHAPWLWEAASTVRRWRSLSTSCQLCWKPAECAVPAQVQGRDLTPILARERQQLEENWGFIETSAGEVGIRTPTHLLGRQALGREGSSEQEPTSFYDLRDDLYEMNNLAGTGQQTKTEAELDNLLTVWDKSTPWMNQI